MRLHNFLMKAAGLYIANKSMVKALINTFNHKKVAEFSKCGPNVT